MGRRQKRVKLKQLDICPTLLKSRQVFSCLYVERNKLSVLMARQNFDTLVETGVMPIPVANRVLNNSKELQQILDAAEKEFLKGEHGKIEGIYKSTRNKAVILTGVIAGTIVGTMFCFLSPFVNAWLQPTADELFKRATKKAEAPKPVLEVKAPVVPTAKKYILATEPFSHPR